MSRKIVSFDFAMSSTEGEMNTNKLSEQRVYTNDTNSVELEFNITDVAPGYLPSVGANAMLYIYMADGSFFVKYAQHLKLDQNRFYYVMTPEEVKRSGMTKVQLIILIGEMEIASPLFDFKIVNGLVKYPIRPVEIRDWDALTMEARMFVEDLQDLTAEEFVELKMDEKLINLERDYAGRLQSTEHQLAWARGGFGTLGDRLNHEVFDMSRMGQDVKEAMTGGSVAVVGKNAILTENIVDKQITPEKTNFIELSKNKFDGAYTDGYMTTEGAFTSAGTGDYTAIIDVEPNTPYTISKSSSHLTRIGLNNKQTFSTQHSEVILNDFSGEYDSGFSFTTNSDQNLLIIYVSPNPAEVPIFMQVEEGSEATEWVTYGYELKNVSTPYFNTNANTPEYFGIKGDGVTDDSDGLNNYAYHLKEQGGGRLELPRKELLIKKTIVIPSNTIVDLSNSVVRLGNDYILSERVWRSGSVMKPYFVTEEGSENIVFKNFSIVGTKQDIRHERHIGLGVFDSKNVDVQNVNVKSINYNPLGEPSFGDMVPGIGLFIIRSEDVTVMGGAFDEGGYENIGTEHSKDIIIDGVHSGKAWRTSIQPHRATQNLKILNSTIHQVTATPNSGAMTLHGQDDIGEGIKNILVSGNTIHGEFSTEPTYGYNALIQILEGGMAEDINILNNVLKGNRTGIYGAPTSNIRVVGNNISLDKGHGIFVYPGSTNVLLDQNIVSTLDGTPLFDSASIATLGTNIGF